MGERLLAQVGDGHPREVVEDVLLLQLQRHRHRGARRQREEVESRVVEGVETPLHLRERLRDAHLAAAQPRLVAREHGFRAGTGP